MADGRAVHNHPSPLPLLVTGIGADHEDDAAAPDDLALLTHAADAGANLHGRTRDDGREGLGTGYGNTNRAPNYKSPAGGSQGGERIAVT